MNPSFQDLLADIGRTDKDTTHTYGHVYDGWFRDVRDSAKNILEVGVCLFGGGCVLALAAYFPNATIFAADISDELCCPEALNHPRIIFLKEDAYNDGFVEKIIDIKFDIIIDDGSHEISAQTYLLKKLAPLLSEKGFYCVEDCVVSQWKDFMPELEALGLRSTIIDMSTDQQPDNTIIRWEKA